MSVNEALSYQDDAIGIGRKGTIDKPYVLKAPFWTVDTLFYAIPKQNNDLLWLFGVFQKIDWKSKDESTGVPSLSKNAINGIDIVIPKQDEQQIIGKCFARLDNLITLHQRNNFQAFFQGNKEKSKQKKAISWEQRKLGDMGTTYTGLSGKTKDDFGHGDAQFVTYMNVFLNPITDPHRTEAVEIDGKQNLVQYGDVFFTTSSETPEEVGMSSVWLEKVDNTYLNSFCFGYRPCAEIELHYLAYMLRSDAVRKSIIFLAQGISRYNISKNGVMGINVPIPKMGEQKRLGAIFTIIDDLITLHQRKGNAVMVSCKLWRSKGEERKNCIAWEQRKLGEVASKVTEKNTQNTVSETFTNSAEFGIISQRDFFDHDIAKADKIDGYYVVQNDDFVYNPRISVTAPCGPINRNKMGRNGVMSPLYTVFRVQGISKLYLEWYFKTSNWHSYMYLNGDSGARSDRFSIKNELFFEMPLPIPRQKEQERIGTILDDLENLITLHQRKCQEKTGLISCDVKVNHYQKNSITWEQRKLGDVGRVAMNKRVFKEQTSNEGEIPFFKIGTFGGEPDAFISKELFEEYKNKYPYPQKGDILLSASGSIGRFIEYQGENAYFQDSNIVWLEHDERVKNVFLKQFYGFVKWHGLEGSTIKRLYNKNILETEISLPNEEEQVNIGVFFEHIDDLITLHQRKEDAKKEKKKHQKMVSIINPKCNSWEQRQFGYFFTERNERSGDGEMISVTINSGIKRFDELNRHDTKPDDLSKYKRVEVGDIAYNSMRMWQGASGYSPYSGILSPAYTVITPKNGVSARFFAYVLKQAKMIHQFEINSQGLTKDTWNLKFPAFAPIEVKAPITYEEQAQIATILLQVDDLITLHQRGGRYYKKEYIMAKSIEKTELFCDYFERWIKVYKDGAIRKVTMNKYMLALSWLRKLIPSLQMGDMDRIAYQKLLNDYAKYHERQTTMDFHHQLKGAILDAVDEGLIPRDPTRKAIIKGKTPRDKKPKYLSQFELHSLLRSLDLGAEVNWDWLILLVAKTGMRFSEALAITPKDFDFPHQTLSISKTWDYKGNGGFLPTKNKSSVRKIQLDWQTVVQFTELTRGKDEETPLFVNCKVYNSTINDVLRRRCKQANIPVISVHGLRHTHASLLLFAGVSIASVARRLGHSSMTTTQKTYLHIIHELENKDIDLVMRALSSL